MKGDRDGGGMEGFEREGGMNVEEGMKGRGSKGGEGKEERREGGK